MNIEIADRLLKYRKANGFSQEELAEKIGVSRQAISKWERSEASPDTDNLIMLAKVYGVTLDDLLLGESEPAARASAAEPDSNAEYVRDERVSFKNGIHITNDSDKVDISFKEGVNVQSKDGSYVHVGTDGVHVQEGDKVKAYTDENGHLMVEKGTERNEHARHISNLVPVWAISLAAFLIWGFSGAFHGWALSWICFLAIPLYHSLVDAIFKRNASHFAYPVLCVAIYAVAGFCNILGGWSLGWIVFITIPIYYGIVNIIKIKN